MARAIFIDTFQIAKNMKEAKYTEIQIEERVQHDTYLIDKINKVISDDLATKADLSLEIEKLRAEMAITKRDTVIWLSGVMIVLLYGPIFIKYLASIIK